MSKSISTNLSAQMNRLCDRRVIPLILVKEKTGNDKVKIMEYEIFRFQLTGKSLMLTDLFCSNVFVKFNEVYYLRKLNFGGSTILIFCFRKQLNWMNMANIM